MPLRSWTPWVRSFINSSRRDPSLARDAAVAADAPTVYPAADQRPRVKAMPYPLSTRRLRSSNFALMATMTVLSDISAAPTAGVRMMPQA